MSSGIDTQTTSRYREFPAPDMLARYFLCFWTQTIAGLENEYVHRVLPDGCIDIVFVNDEPPTVVGPWTEPFVVRLAAGTKILGARLRPGCASNVLRLPSAELLNVSVPLCSVWGKSRSEEFVRVPDQRGLAARSSTLAEVLFGCLPSAITFDRAIAASIAWLGRHPHSRIEQLSECIGISGRQLHRRFSTTVGYGPKMFQSVLRFQRVLYLSHEGQAVVNFADLAAEAGYADQAHMTREVRRFGGCAPKALLSSAECTLVMSDLFKTRYAPSPYCSVG
jgi:AraC-like DNA-binding protein